MTNADEILLQVSLEERWPGKYSEADVKFWRDRLASRPLAEVQNALVAWANGDKGRFPPKVVEIEALLKPAAEAARPKRSTVIATSVVTANPHMAKHSDLALTLAFYRGQYLVRLKEFEGRA